MRVAGLDSRDVLEVDDDFLGRVMEIGEVDRAIFGLADRITVSLNV